MDDPFLFRREEATELFLIRHADAIPEETKLSLAVFMMICPSAAWVANRHWHWLNVYNC